MFNSQLRRGAASSHPKAKSVHSTPPGTGFSLEGLEARQLLSAATVGLSHGGVLSINGSTHADVVSISPSSRHHSIINVAVNGTVTTFRASQIHNILVSGGKGNDSITLASSVTVPATLSGGSGNDTLVGGGGDDNLDGGTGDDNLTGGPGHCHIDGGNGNDHVDFGPAGGVPLSQVPAPVAAGLTALAQGATITTVCSFNDDGQTYYGTIVPLAGVSTRIVVDSAGNPVSSSQEHPPRGHDRHGPPLGSVVSVDAVNNTITVLVGSENGPPAQQTFTVAAHATVTVDGQPSMLAALPTGAWVALRPSVNDPSTVTGIATVAHRVHGNVVSVDTVAHTITLAGDEGGANQTFSLSSDVTIHLGHTTGTLAQVTVGSEADLTFSTLNSSSVIDVLVHGQGDGGQGDGGNGGGGQGGGGQGGGPVDN